MGKEERNMCKDWSAIYYFALSPISDYKPMARYAKVKTFVMPVLYTWHIPILRYSVSQIMGDRCPGILRYHPCSSDCPSDNKRSKIYIRTGHMYVLVHVFNPADIRISDIS